MPARISATDAYFAKLSPEQRATLQKVRAAIRAAAPDAVEGMSYGLPAFIQGKPIAGFAASAEHCAYYPMSGSIVETLAAELKDYETSKGAIRFPVGKPLPVALVRKLVKARLAEIAEAVPESAPAKKASKAPAKELAAKKAPAAKKAATKRAPAKKSAAKRA